MYAILLNACCILQAMQSFSAALASGQLGPLMQQFNLGDDVANAAAAGGELYARYKHFTFNNRKNENLL